MEIVALRLQTSFIHSITETVLWWR